MLDLNKITTEQKKFFANQIGVKYNSIHNIDYAINFHNDYVEDIVVPFSKFIKYCQKHNGQSLNYVMSKDRQKVIDHIKYGEVYNNLLNTPKPVNFNKIDFKPKEGSYISIDIVKANWSVFADFGGISMTWEQLLKSLRVDSFLQYSRSFRQQIFGNLNPKKIQNLQKGIIMEIYDKLSKNKLVNIHMVGADEIIIENNGVIDKQAISAVLKIFSDRIPLRITEYELKRKKCRYTNSEYFYKVNNDLRYNSMPKLWGVPKKLFFIHQKDAMNKSLNKEDITIHEDGIDYKVDVKVNFFKKVGLYL